jgi:Cu-Zn family superoxide dismutase
MQKKIFILIVFFTLSSSPFAEAMEEAYAEIINNKGKNIGLATLKQGTDGVVIRIDVGHLKPGVHGMHIHEIGDCSDFEKFDRARGHMALHGQPHGYFHPDGPQEGNLPNLIVGKDSRANVEIYTDLVSLSGKGWKPELLGEQGSALIIHENEDDHFTQPSGNSGKRIACGVITLKKGSAAEGNSTFMEDLEE